MKFKYISYLACVFILIGLLYEDINGIIIKKDCDLFSSGLDFCNTACTETSCDSISRKDFLNHISLNAKILEIGPYINPLLKGINVKYFDVLDKNAIKDQILYEENTAIKNYVNKDADLKNIPNIEFVNSQGDLSVIKEKFEIILSAHNIEHQIDLISHLNQVADLLEKNGKFYLIIPDKRYCFDHFIPESPISDIIDNFYNANRDKHSLQSILAMNCETTHNNASLHWSNKHGQIKGKDYACYNEAIQFFNNNKEKYINAHRWRFTPKQFEFIINELNKMNLISLKVEKIYPTEENSQEFMALLYKP